MLYLTKYIDFTKFLTRTYSESDSNDHLHAEFIQTKYNMSTICLDNHHQSVFLAADWSLCSLCPGLAESNCWLARISAGQCLKFRDDRSSVATLTMLNNLQDLAPDYWKAIFWFNELCLVHGSAGQQHEQCHSALSCWNRKSPFNKQWMSGSNPCSSSVRDHSNKHCSF